jgi:CubicO group peptidase (beta-lactamase class C family)
MVVEGPFSYSADYPYKGPRKLFSGGAGLVSTAQDYARFCQFILDGGKVPLKEIGSDGSLGWGGFFYTAFSIDPREQMIVIFMGQLHPTGDLTLDREVHALAYQAISD